MAFAKILMAVLMVSTLASCASSPHANEDPQLDSGGQGGKTKYQIIIESYDRAGILPEVKDFDVLDEFRPKTRCFMTRAAEPEGMVEVVIRQVPVTYSGTPSYGPLFPGAPDRKETILVLGKDTAWVNSTSLTNEKRQVFELHAMGSTLVIKINENQFGIYQDFGNPAEIWLRKGENGHIFFKIFKLDAEHNRGEASVGYCFRN